MQRFFVSEFSFFVKYSLFRVFIGTICGIIPRFLLGGLLQALMKQNQKYFYLRNIGYFRDICHKLYLNKMFCSRCCGICDSYSWVTYLPKIFWAFPWMLPTRFVGYNLWEIPPKKGYGNMFQNIFKELFVDISNN